MCICLATIFTITNLKVNSIKINYYDESEKVSLFLSLDWLSGPGKMLQ